MIEIEQAMEKMDAVVARLDGLLGSLRAAAESAETSFEVLDRLALAAERQAAAQEEQALAAWQLVQLRAAYTCDDGDDAAIFRAAETARHAAAMGVTRVAEAVRGRLAPTNGGGS